MAEKPTPPSNVRPFPPMPRDDAPPPPSVPVRIVQVQMSIGQLKFLTSLLRGRAQTLREMAEKRRGSARPSERAMMAVEADSTDSLLVTVERTARELTKPSGEDGL